MAMRSKTLYIDEDIWNEAKELARTDLNMSLSGFIELILKQTIQSKTQSMKDMYQNMAEDLFRYAEIKGKKKNFKEKK
jgi:antitoxin component of RelBE/YafQ-DinJ toxin-antitoxin module